ncbi:MAG: NADH-quinone oxidoreductase subunit K [Candidatus Saganbacteria bacterium]|nr:NADH-quinone oxidoreductase subunit K [Candidatus Saganbacteria bacterium]
MIGDITLLFWMFGIFVVCTLVCGIYCMLMTYNLLRVLIGLEIVIKAVTLMLVAAGYLSGHTALAQGIVITVIVIEVVVMIVAAGVVVGFQRHYDSLNVKNTRMMKG